jgi:hypothetical protein
MEKIKIRPYKNNRGYTIYFSTLKNRLIINKFIKLVGLVIKEEKQYITLNLMRCKPPSFPNLICSLSGLIELYKKEFGLKFNVMVIDDSYIDYTRFFKPYLPKKHFKILGTDIFDKVIKFNDEFDVKFISESLLLQLQKLVVCKQGVLIGISWCLNEIMDNVLNHSNSISGYLMCQIQRKNHTISLSVFDNGIGLYNSLKDSVYSPKDTIHAIKLSTEEGVTRDITLGQGNGMWGLKKIVLDNKGSLSVISGSGAVIYDYNESYNERTYMSLAYPSKTFNTTLLDISFNFKNTINISSALGNYEPYEFITRKNEELEIAEGTLKVDVALVTVGTGTRKAAKEVRNYLINLHNTEGKKILIDFVNIDMITSSYADELVGKLTVIFGLNRFDDSFNVINCKQIVYEIINKAIFQRQLHKT